MNYTERLIRFNSSKKYLAEMEFILKLIEPKAGQRILDYGCGLGTFINFIKDNSKADVTGYDVEYLGLGEIPGWFVKEPSGLYDSIYFMHSLAHIKDAEDMFTRLKKYLKVDGKIIINTPNKNWDAEMKPLSNNYNPDTTVIRHYTPEELERFFTILGFKIYSIGQFGKLLNGHHERIFLVAQI